MKRIIYPTPDGGVAIIIPSVDWLMRQEDNPMEALASKDVPAGVPYKIIDTADVPTDRTFRNAWEYQE